MMKRALSIGLAMLAALLGTAAHAAEAYPVKPVRMVVPQAAGGNADAQARYIAERLSEVLGKQFVVDNRAGANGMIGMEIVARSLPDGYTLAAVPNTFTATPALFVRVPYDALRDFQGVSMISTSPMLMVASPSLSAGSVKDVIALAKSRPGELNYGSSGNGGPTHLAGALFELLAGVKLVHVPYKGVSGSNLDVMAGRIPLGFASFLSSLPLVKAGKMKALGITSKARSPLAPGIPTIEEAGVPQYESTVWNGILAPSRTPRPIVNRLNAAIVEILTSQQARERYANVGAEIRYNSPDEFQVLIREETAKWAKVIKAAGIRLDGQ
jgi:tripartite-type tricarboxylate transporter receptor subunit TctC